MPARATDGSGASRGAFASDVVDRVRAAGGVWELPGGCLMLPRAFGFCRGVERAIKMLQQAVRSCVRRGKRLFLLGQIIHNPWVNEHFERQSVRILTREESARARGFLTGDDCAVIPAFGVPPAVERTIRSIGCEIVDTSCGNVRRLWAWAERAAADGRGVLIFGRPGHDETFVTKSRLAEAGGSYLVAEGLEQVAQFCRLVREGLPPGADMASLFGAEATNAALLEPFLRLAQASQTTMLHDQTVRVRQMLREAFSRRFGSEQAAERLLLEPTICRATQDRQSAAIDLCSSGVDMAVVVGGFGSSNTRHLYELARQYGPACFIEDGSAIRCREEIDAFDPGSGQVVTLRDWLPRRPKLRLAVLAGASTPEAVVGDVLERLAKFLA